MPLLRFCRFILALVLLWTVVAMPSPLFAEVAVGLSSAAQNTDGASARADAVIQTSAEAGGEPSVRRAVVEGADVFAEPAPVRTEPEPVMLRAEFQPAPVEPPLLMEKEEADSSQIELLPVLTMLVDDSAITFEDAAGRFGEFQPYDGQALLKQSGVLWLHLALDNVGHDSPGSLRLDLGAQLPPLTEVWLSSDGIRWNLAAPEADGVYSLAEAGDAGQALIRMDGMPGLWFSPALRPLFLAMQSPEREAFAFARTVLGLLGALCFFLCLGLRGESRFWTFILAGAAAVQAHWSVPATAAGLDVSALPSIFSAGVALLMLPHIGRVLMRTRMTAPWVDLFFMVLALLGVCAALLPLVPGMTWAARLLVLWPLVAVLCFLPSFILLIRGVQGSLPFTLACLAMGGGAVLALCGLPHGLEAPLWGSAVFFGPALGLLFLTAASPSRIAGRTSSDSEALGGDTRPNTYKESAVSLLRRSVKSSVEELLDEACRLDQALNRAGVNAEHVDIMARADGLVAAARRLSEKTMESPAPESLPESSEEDFDLRSVIQSVFSSVFEEAESRGLGLSWYVAPHLGRRYKGDSARLTALLSLMLSDSVRASSSGAVSLRVRRANRTHPGHLFFTVADTGDGLPPQGRSSTLLARIWEFASSCGGELFVSSGPEGTELGFSMVCTAYEEDGVTERPIPGERDEEGNGGTAAKHMSKLVIAASAGQVSRQMISYYLGGMGFRIWEARDASEAASLYAAEPAALMVFDGSLAEDDMVQALASVRMHEGERSLPAVPFLLLAHDALQAERMGKAGCDEALLPPLLRKDLRAMVKWLTAPSGSVPKPVLSSQRVTLAAVLAGASAGPVRLQRKDRLKPLREYGETAAEAEETAVSASVPVVEEPASAGEEPVSVVPQEMTVPADNAEETQESSSPAAEDDKPSSNSRSDVSPVADVLSVDVVPTERIAQGLDALKTALVELDTYSVRRGSAALASIAEACGMHTLADMARCFRAAWEEGDLDAASQIVEEMRSENSRFGNRM